jgi:RimJ/RimL family protein N-acetyltransferase
MQIHRTKDKAEIVSVLGHPKVLSWVVDDGFTGEYDPFIHDAIYYLTDPDVTAIATAVPMNGICCQAHLAALPAMWGKSTDFVRSCIEWFFENTKYQKIVGMVPEYNRLSMRVCRNVGMKQEGVLTKAFLRNWELHSLVIFGISKHKEDV